MAVLPPSCWAIPAASDDTAGGDDGMPGDCGAGGSGSATVCAAEADGGGTAGRGSAGLLADGWTVCASPADARSGGGPSHCSTAPLAPARASTELQNQRRGRHPKAVCERSGRNASGTRGSAGSRRMRPPRTKDVVVGGHVILLDFGIPRAARGTAERRERPLAASGSAGRARPAPEAAIVCPAPAGVPCTRCPALQKAANLSENLTPTADFTSNGCATPNSTSMTCGEISAVRAPFNDSGCSWCGLRQGSPASDRFHAAGPSRTRRPR